LDGTISVRTTEQGLPVAIRVDGDELRSRDPQELARKIVRLCERARTWAGVAKRAELVAAGTSSEIIAAWGLPTQQDLLRQEQLEEYEFGEAPDSWVRRSR
jgi:hypothetical protein